MPRGLWIIFVWLGSLTGAVAQLPLEVTADRYLLQAEELMAAKDYQAALDKMDQILVLQKEHNLTLPAGFHFQYAQAAMGAGSLQVAMAAATQYLANAGRESKFYREALKLLNLMEQLQTQLAQYPAQVEQLMAAKDYAGALEVMDEVVTLQKEHNLTLPEDFHSKRVKIRVAKEPCTGQPKGTSCWMELANVPGCYVWNPDFQVAETVTWTGECAESFAQGTGTLKWIWDCGQKSLGMAGSLQAGKQQGEWVLDDRNGGVWEGSYVEGKKHGNWIWNEKDGDVHEGPFVNGMRHGHWVQRWASGGVWEGPFVEGKRHGAWVQVFPDGQVEEGPYVEGKKDGNWTIRPVDRDVWRLFYADGKKFYGTGEGPIVDGKRHGTWVIREEDGDIEKGSFVEGRLHGRWIWRKKDGLVWQEGSYKEGKRHGQWITRFTSSDERGHIKSEGSYKEGKKHGQWAESEGIATHVGTSGAMREGSYVDGKRHGQWVRKSTYVRSANDVVKTTEHFDYELGRIDPIKPEMVVIPAGSFWMGCVSGRDCGYNDRPVHQVQIESFELGKYEVTFEEYDQFTAATGWEWALGKGRGRRPRRPVAYVSWEDAVAYTGWLSEQTGERYRLPSEAEWEYAARAGTVTKYSWGNEIGRNRANCHACGSQYGRQTAPVGSFAPNGWGLHDMHGNVSEWVQDCSNSSYRGAPADGSAWESGGCSLRVFRGGSRDYDLHHLRSASRFGNTPSFRHDLTGFRVARTSTP